MTQNQPKQPAVTEAEFLHQLVNNKVDPILGASVHGILRAKGLETPFLGPYLPQEAFKSLLEGVHDAMNALGLDMMDPSLKDTPERFAKMFIGELTVGLSYSRFPKCTATPKPKGMDQMVVVRNLEVISLCEHHLQTIKGVCHVAYIPSHVLLGLSKFARLVEFFSRRPQVQERLTEQGSHSLRHILGTDDVAVSITATHGCMQARGALQHQSDTQTNVCSGVFLSKPEAREEFFNALR